MRQKHNPQYVVIEILNGERIRRISGSYRYCAYVAEEFRQCGFKVVIELDKTE